MIKISGVYFESIFIDNISGGLVMPVRQCQYYKFETELFVSKGRRPSRSAPEPQYVQNEWCEHKKSPRRKNERVKLICQGDINECPIGLSNK
jgi:hypothetical protein